MRRRSAGIRSDGGRPVGTAAPRARLPRSRPRPSTAYTVHHNRNRHRSKAQSCELPPTTAALRDISACPNRRGVIDRRDVRKRTAGRLFSIRRLRIGPAHAGIEEARRKAETAGAAAAGSHVAAGAPWPRCHAEEIQKRLWPENTYVDFDNAIKSAVRDDAHLKLFQFQDQAIRSLASLPGPIGDEMSISPDERWPLYERFNYAGSELMLVENIR